MPRKRRKQLVGPAEDKDRRRREREYDALEDELHRDWQARQSEARPGEQPVTDDDTTTA